MDFLRENPEILLPLALFINVVGIMLIGPLFDLVGRITGWPKRRVDDA